MALRSALSRPSVDSVRRPHWRSYLARKYATVQPVILVGKAPGPPQTTVQPTVAAPSVLDALVLSELRKARGVALPAIVQHYEDRSGSVLDDPLPYESRPDKTRRVTFDGTDGVVMVAHAIQHGDAHKVALCTGFVLNVPSESSAAEGGESQVVLTCAHTLEEVNGWTSLSPRSRLTRAWFRAARCATLRCSRHYSLHAILQLRRR